MPKIKKVFMKNLEIAYIETKKLKLNPNNPRKNDEAVDTVAKSIEKYGFKNPVIADKNLIVYCGNTRLKAAKKLKLQTIPVIIADDLTPEQIREYALIDNKSNEIAEWDTELLAQELEELDLSDFDLDWGLPTDVADKEITEDEAPEVDEKNEPICKLGDIWQLGKHRLLCGDSTEAVDVEKLMDGGRASLLLTDPPYNVAYEGATKEKLTIQNDNMKDDEFYAFLQAAFENANSVMQEGASFYIWHADSEGFNFRSACQTTGWKIRQCLIWVKNSIVLGRQDYQWKHEPCLYGWKDGAAHYFVDDRTQSTVWEFNKPVRNGDHPTMKPVELMAKAIINSSRRGNIVLDLFGGSGSTLIACEQLDRRCFTMELDPKYCDVIIKRWENLTGQKAVKL